MFFSNTQNKAAVNILSFISEVNTFVGLEVLYYATSELVKGSTFMWPADKGDAKQTLQLVKAEGTQLYCYPHIS